MAQISPTSPAVGAALHRPKHRSCPTLTLTPPPQPRVTTLKRLHHRHHLRKPTTPPATADPLRRTSRSAPSDVLKIMDCLQLPVDADLYASLLAECTATLDPIQGSLIHAHLRRGGERSLRTIEDVLLVANRLLLMYSQCGLQEHARKVFDKMLVRDLFTWAIMVAGYSHRGDHATAVEIFSEMLEGGWKGEEVACLPHRRAGVVSIAAVLRSCAKLAGFEFGQCVHGLILKVGGSASSSDPCGSDRWPLGTSLLRFYGEFGCIESARRIFECGCLHNSMAACTAMMAAYRRQHMFREAVEIFRRTGRIGRWKCSLLPGAIKACARSDDAGGGIAVQLHAITIKVGVDSTDRVALELVMMYGRLGLMEEARKVFDKIGGKKDHRCWRRMFDVYAKWGCCREAIRLLYEMRAAGVEPGEYMLKEARLLCGSR